MDQPRTYTTSRIASAVGIHPNTVRLYERIGFITAPERLANGYRVFTDLHLLQVRLVRAALNVELVQNGLRREVLAIVETMASQRYDEAISLARQRIGASVVPPRMPCATCAICSRALTVPHAPNGLC